MNTPAGFHFDTFTNGEDAIALPRSYRVQFDGKLKPVTTNSDFLLTKPASDWKPVILLKLLHSIDQNVSLVKNALETGVKGETLFYYNTIRCKRVYSAHVSRCGKDLDAVEAFIVDLTNTRDLNTFRREHNIVDYLLKRLNAEAHSLKDISADEDLKRSLLDIASDFLKLPSVEGIEISYGDTTKGIKQSNIELWNFEPTTDLKNEVRLKAVTLLKDRHSGSFNARSPILRNASFRMLRVSTAKRVRNAYEAIASVYYTSTKLKRGFLHFVEELAAKITQILIHIRPRAKHSELSSKFDAVLRCLPCEIALFYRSEDSEVDFVKEDLSSPFKSSDSNAKKESLREIENETPALLKRVVSKQIPLKFTIGNTLKNVLFEVHFEPVMEKGVVTSVVRYINDISQTGSSKIRADFFSNIIDGMGKGILITDEDLNLLYSNEMAANKFGFVPSLYAEEKTPLTHFLNPLHGWSRVQNWLDGLSVNIQGKDPYFFEAFLKSVFVEIECYAHDILGKKHFVMVVSDASKEAVLTRELDRIRETFTRVSDAVLFLDAGFKIVDFNAGASTLFGLSGADSGRHIGDIAHFRSKDGKAFNDLIAIAKRNGLWEGFGVVDLHDFDSLHVFLRVLAMTTEDNRITGYSIVVTDHTKREKDSRLLAAIGEFGDTLSWMDRSLENATKILYEMKRIFGMREAALLISQPDSESTTPPPQLFPNDIPLYLAQEFLSDIGPPISQHLSKSSPIICSGDAHSLFLQLFSQKESLLPPPYWISLIGQDKASGMLMLWPSPSAFEEINIDKQTVKSLTNALSLFIEQAITLDNAKKYLLRLNSLLDRTVSSIVVFNRLGEIKYSNQNYKQLLGGPDISNILLDNVLGTGKELIDMGIWKRILKGEMQTIETEVEFNDGSNGIFRWTVSPFTGTGAIRGKPEEFIATGENITSLIEMAAITAEAETAREFRVLTGKISHVFNNSLTVVFGMLRSLEELIGKADSTALKKLNTITQYSERMSSLVSSLLAYSGQTLGRRSLFSFDEAVENALRNIAEDFPDVDISADLTCGRTLIDSVESCIGVITEELVRNAAQAALECEDPKIRVSTCIVPETLKEGKGITSKLTFQLSVKDNGSGFSPETKEKAFDLFFSTKESPDGKVMGLGLPQVQSLARLLQGDVSISSEPGNTVVTVNLSSTRNRDTTILTKTGRKYARKNNSKTAEARIPIASGQEAPLVVVLDDDPSVLEIIKNCMDTLHLHCRAFCKPEAAEAFMLSNSERISALLLDFDMGEVNGAEFISSLEAKGWDKPVYLCTGYGNDILEDSRLDCVVGVIAKPITISDLRKNLRMFLPHSGEK